MQSNQSSSLPAAKTEKSRAEKSRLLAQDDTRPQHANLANLVTSTIHLTVVHELTSKSKFAKRAISFANLPSLQTCSALTTLPGISRAPTSLVRVRAQKKCPLSRAGKCRVEREVSFFPLLAGSESTRFHARESCFGLFGERRRSPVRPFLPTRRSSFSYRTLP